MRVLEPTTAKGRATRERILRAAAELVSEQGAAGMSLDDVGARARASKSQIYHYFLDRDDLIRAVVDATTAAVLGAQEELLARLDTWDGIDRWFDALIAVQRERAARGGCPIGSLVGQLAERDQLARAGLADGFDRWESKVRDGLERMQRTGSLRPDASAAELATAVMALLQGGLLLAQVRRDPGQLETSLASARSLLRAAASDAKLS